MESGNKIAYIVFVVLAILIICVGAWYRRRRIAIARAQQQAADQYSPTILQQNNWDNVPLRPQAVHLVYEPHSPQQNMFKPEYLPPYQPPSSPLEPPPPSYPGPSNNHSDSIDTLTPPTRTTN